MENSNKSFTLVRALQVTFFSISATLGVALLKFVNETNVYIVSLLFVISSTATYLLHKKEEWDQNVLQNQKMMDVFYNMQEIETSLKGDVDRSMNHIIEDIDKFQKIHMNKISEIKHLINSSENEIIQNDSDYYKMNFNSNFNNLLKNQEKSDDTRSESIKNIDSKLEELIKNSETNFKNLSSLLEEFNTKNILLGIKSEINKDHRQLFTLHKEAGAFFNKAVKHIVSKNTENTELLRSELVSFLNKRINTGRNINNNNNTKRIEENKKMLSKEQIERQKMQNEAKMIQRKKT